MQAASLPARHGWQWIRAGYALVMRQPMPMLSLSVLISLMLLLAQLTPPFGPAIFIILIPTITAVTLGACRRIAQGEGMALSDWNLPLKEPGVLKRLLMMGILYIALGLAGGVLIFLPFMENLATVVDSLTPDSDITPLLQALRTPVLLFAGYYLLLSALFWQAPALVLWHRVALLQSLFFSWIACWRNKLPLFLYGLCWAALFLGVDLLLSLLLGVGIPVQILGMLQAPLMVFLSAVLYCSFYPIYTDIFERPVVEDAAA